MYHISCNFLEKCQITQVTQHPYSPDLVLCDFWLFPKLESTLKGKIIQTTDDMTGQLIVTRITV